MCSRFDVVVRWTEEHSPEREPLARHQGAEAQTRCTDPVVAIILGNVVELYIVFESRGLCEAVLGVTDVGFRQ